MDFRTVNASRVTPSGGPPPEGATLRVRVLGPLEIERDEGQRVELPASQARLLGLLVVGANQVVSVDRLAEEMWSGAPPPSAVTTLRAHVSRLRRALGRDELISTRGQGYVLALTTQECDLLLFDQLVASGRKHAAAGDQRAAVDTYGQALALWRGGAFEELSDSPWALSEVSRLTEARLATVEARIGIELDQGKHAAVIGELEALCAAHPLREVLWASRLIALYRSGRQAEALRTYQVLRQHLGDELGIDPSPELRELEARILAQDPALLAPVAQSVPASSPVATPSPERALPSGVVTFLLTDIVGSTETWEAHPAAMDVALRRHDALVAEAVEQGGGVVLKNKGEGDATLSVFRRASDAVSTAARLQHDIQAEAWPDPLALRVRMAVHTGEANERDGDYFGPAVNRAARIRSLALGGHVLLSAASAEVVADRLPDGTTLRPVGRQRLRGMVRQEDVYALEGEGLSVPEVVTDYAEGVEAPDSLAQAGGPGVFRPPLPAALDGLALGFFVGRDKESSVLDEAWTQAKDGGHRVVLIGGEPGVGKTRLVAQLARRAHDQGAVVLLGRCDPEGAIVYQPFIEALRALVDALPAQAFAQVIGPAIPALSMILPELADGQSSGTGLAAPGASRVDAEMERNWLFDAVARTLSRLSEQAPVVLVIDDLHWAPRPTLALVAHLIRARAVGGLLILATYRDTELDRTHPLAEALPGLRSEPDVERLSLHGLSGEGVVDYLKAAADEDLDQRGLDLAIALHAETQGNPLFVQEVLAHLIETEVIFRDEEGHWTAQAGVSPGALDLPEGIREVIGRRLSRLSEEANKALAVAAVIGPVFTPSLVEAVVGTDCLDVFDEALAAGLLREESPGLAFAHALVRQVVYTELSSLRRARLHRQVGEAMETSHAPDAHSRVLFHHFGEGALDGGARKALQYAIQTLQELERRNLDELTGPVFDEAIQLQEMALPQERRLRGELLTYQASNSLIPIVEAEESGRQAVFIARELQDPRLLARAALARARRTEVARLDPDLEPLCREALDALGEDDDALRVGILSALARLLAWHGHGVDAYPLAQSAVILAREAGDPVMLHVALNAAFYSLAGGARPEEQLALAEERVALARRTGDRYMEMNAVIERSGARMELGDLGGWRSDLSVDLRLPEFIGQNFMPYEHVTDALMTGRFGQADKLSSDFINLPRTSSTYALVGMGQQLVLHRELGRLPDVAPLLEASSADNPSVLVLKALNTLVRLEIGDLGGATELFESVASAGFRSHPQDHLWPSWLAFLSEACVGLGDRARAAELYGLLLPHGGHLLNSGQGAICLASADRLLGMLAATTGDAEEAERRYRSALALEEEGGLRPFAARTHLWFARLLLLQPGRRSEALDHLERARMLAGELGMAGVAAEAAGAIDTRDGAEGP